MHDVVTGFVVLMVVICIQNVSILHDVICVLCSPFSAEHCFGLLASFTLGRIAPADAAIVAADALLPVLPRVAAGASDLVLVPAWDDIINRVWR